MATSIPPHTWKNGFRQITKPVEPTDINPTDANRPYVNPAPQELPTSNVDNSHGKNFLRTWPSLYNGTEAPNGRPDWWKPSSEVDVLIIGAGPTGLETALSLSRQDVSFRILDKGKTPLIAGRADSVLPRYLETLSSWGIAPEVHEEGPIIERTAVWKDGKVLFHGRSHQSDSRYRGLHVITQGQLERIFIRDLLRHGTLVERDTQLLDYETSNDLSQSHPITAKIKSGNGEEETVKAKFLVGCDGAASGVRRKLGIPFDGVSTDIYWAIMDGKFKSDYPHAWIFGGVLNTQHGAVVIIPREDGYNRLYVQLDLSKNGAVAESRQSKDATFQEAGGQVDVQSITPDEVLAQANRIFTPYKIEFEAPLSWFAIWKVSERIARQFSSPDLRVHIAGDAAHTHSVFGAFGLNASILDAANLGWKIGLCARGKADLQKLLPSYDRERRLHAADIIEISGTYLRYSCNRWDQEVPKLHRAGEPFGEEAITRSVRGKVSGIPMPPGVELPEHLFLPDFYMRYGAFLLGLDIAYGPSMLNAKQDLSEGVKRPVIVENGVRCPSPRVCFNAGEAGYLYDKMKGSAIFHILVFGSDLQGPVRQELLAFSKNLPDGFYGKFGGREVFNIILVTKCMPFEMEARLVDPGMSALKDAATVVYDDRPPDEDAHYTFGIDHSKGAVVVTRPDLWVGMSIFPSEAAGLEKYFAQFMIPHKLQNSLTNGHATNGVKADDTPSGLLNGNKTGKLVYSTELSKKWLLNSPPSKAKTNGTAVDTANGGPSVAQLNEEAENDLGNADRGGAKAHSTYANGVPADKAGAAKTKGAGEYFVSEAASAKASH